MRAPCCRLAVPGRLDDRVRDRIIAETARQSAGAGGAVAGDEPGRAGRGLRAARGGRSSESADRGVPAARRRLARGDAATDAAGGSGSAGGRHAAVAGGRTSCPPIRAHWLTRRKPGCWRSTTRFASVTRWCARRCTEPRHRTNDGASTTRWRRRAIPSSLPTTARGTAHWPPPGRTKPWPPTSSAPQHARRAAAVSRPQRRCSNERPR